MQEYVLFFDQINRSSLALAGGKGANLGEMTQAGLPVPGGFCVTTWAYQDFIATSAKMEDFFAELNALDLSALHQLRELGQRIRDHLLQLSIPPAITRQIIKAWEKAGVEHSYAVRSSATAEDLPNASFAGQQDTYLNIRGQEELLHHIRKGWASLFTDRAIAYRVKNGFDHRAVYLAVVVQKMVIADIAGIMFTADPATGNRTVVSIDASFGLGEALVSGLVSADLYKVKNLAILSKKISQKKLAIYSVPAGGTITQELPLALQAQQVLTDHQIIELAALGKKIEQHYGQPQDIEFCVMNNELFVVQSRPITTLYPLPAMPMTPVRVLLSFGHVQMMTDAMKPLGLTAWKKIFSDSLFREAGGRLFIDLSDILQHKLARILIPKILTIADEPMSRALDAIVNRPEFIKRPRAAEPVTFAAVRKLAAPIIRKMWANLRHKNPELARAQVEAYMEERTRKTRQALRGVRGAERIKAVQQQLDTLLLDIADNILPYVAAGVIAYNSLKRIIRREFGDVEQLNKLNKSLPGNITSEMGLALGDLADKARDWPEVQEYLKKASDQNFYLELEQVPGGKPFSRDFAEFIHKYGVRCPGEIDITAPRWQEAPTRLVSAILSNIRSLKPGEHRQRFAAGEKEAAAAAAQVLQAVKGSYKSKLASRLIHVYRHLGGLREHHKFLIVTVFGACKQAIMAEADWLVETGVLEAATDVYFLRLEELYQLLQGSFDGNVIALLAERKAQYQRYQQLKPPRVMTSEGEIVVIPARKDYVPAGTLPGSPVSAGVAEGTARVLLRPEDAVLNEGEILVAPHTDPGWTPLFQSAIAIVTEVGGLMTHGAVVAREYGIPAVVGVDDATRLINDGDRIRVDGVQGFVEIVARKQKKI